MMISDRIFAKLQEYNMSQKDFSERTGIPQSTISDWKKKRTNPTAEKILIICKVLNVSLEWLLSGVEQTGKKEDLQSWYAVDSDSDAGRLVSTFNSLDSSMQERLLGYAEAIKQIADKQ